ncbi:MAG: hypothetical protein HY862_20580 [Chloroflexi bacterium]|nr:hypothetical protein [Chloroflexota bacterium]
MTTEAKSPITQLTSRPFRLNFWAIALTAWVTFGIATLLNGLALKHLNPDFPGYGPVNLPDNMREAIWLVLGMWAGGYIGGFLCGVWQERPGYHASMVWSAVLGYEIAVGLRLMLIGYFPDVAHEAFTEALDLFYLNSLPTYPAFFVMVMFLGALMVGLAVVTGSFTASGALAKALPMPKIDGTTVIVAALLPMTLLFLQLALLNMRDIDLAPGIEASGGTRTAGILHIDALISPIMNMLVASVVGIRFGRAFFQRFQPAVIYGAGAGVMVHLLSLVIIYQVLTMYEPTSTNAPDLHLLIPKSAFWLILWIGPVFAAMVVTFVFQVLLLSLFGERPSTPLPDSSQPA